MMLLGKKRRLINTFSAVYTYGEYEGFYPIYEYQAESIEDLDRFALDVMELKELPHPYKRISCHVLKKEWKWM